MDDTAGPADGRSAAEPAPGRPTGGSTGTDVWSARTGQRVVVRHRLPAGGLTDTVGLLVSASDRLLVVRTRHGDVEVPRPLVVTGKVVPPRPSRPAPPHLAPSVTDLAAVLALHWNPADATRFGGWWLRAAGGFTNRANAVVPLGAPDRPDGEALTAVQSWYAVRGLPAQFSLAGPVAGGVPAAPDEPAARVRALVTAAGWQVVEDGSALVLVAPTGALRSSPDLPAGLTLALAAEPDEGWRRTYRYRGQALPADALAVLTSAPEQVFCSVRAGDRTVACARGSVGGGWAGVTAVEVDPEHRRRGLATLLLGTIARWAWSRGAASTFLQTAESNLVAQALYSRAGFVPHHRYDYVRAPAG